MTYFYLIRHARSIWNAEQRIQGQRDIPLNDVGREQARQLGSHLRPVRFDAAYVSPLSRARETAEIALESHNLELRFDQRFIERDSGEWTGMSGDDITAYRLLNPDVDWRRSGPPGSEAYPVFVARVAEVLDELIAKHPQNTLAIVTHGGVVNACLHHLLRIPLAQVVTFRIPNASITRVHLKDDEVRVVAMGDDKHLAGM